MKTHIVHAICAIAAIFLVLPPAAEAADPPVEVEYEVGHLAKGEIPLTTDQRDTILKTPGLTSETPIEITDSTGKLCKLKLVPPNTAGRPLVIKAGANGVNDCKQLWLQKDPKQIDFPLDSDKNKALLNKPLQLKPRVPTKSIKPPFTLESGNTFRCKVCTNSAPSYSVYHFSDRNGWKESPLDPSGLFDIPNLLGADPPTPLEGFINFDESGKAGYFAFKLEPGDLKPNPEGRELGTPCPPVKKFPSFCKATLDDKLDLICVDLVTNGEKPAVRFSAETRQILRPNRSVLVKVRHLALLELTVEMEGARGLFEPTVRSQVPSKDDKATAARDIKCDPTERVTEATFGPRLPGKADIIIKTKPASDPSAKENVHTIELFIERTYFGAIRLGVASVFAGAVDVEYEARTVGGSGQAEVAAKTAGPMNAELVLGFSPYLIDYIARNGEGRPEVTPRATGFAPYFGIGLLNANGTGLELLKSIHLGVEYEFIPSFSLAATGVLRRVTRLAPGVEVGSAVSGSVPTTTGYGFGAGLVLNFSPEFLRLAAQSSSGFFK